MKFLTQAVFGLGLLGVAAVSTAAPINYTAVLDGSISTYEGSFTNQSLFKFSGSQGDAVTITVERLENFFDPAFSLYSGADDTNNTNFLVSADDELPSALYGPFGDPQLLDYLLPETGDYTLQVYNSPSFWTSFTAPYDFSLSINGLAVNTDTSAEVSEPAIAALFGLSLCGVAGMRRKKAQLKSNQASI